MQLPFAFNGVAVAYNLPGENQNFCTIHALFNALAKSCHFTKVQAVTEMAPVCSTVVILVPVWYKDICHFLHCRLQYWRIASERKSSCRDISMQHHILE